MPTSIFPPAQRKDMHVIVNIRDYSLIKFDTDIFTKSFIVHKLIIK